MLASILLLVASLNVNKTPVDSLQTLRGVGPVIAERIDAERKVQPFKSCEDVQSRVKGIGDKKIAKICPELEF